MINYTHNQLVKDINHIAQCVQIYSDEVTTPSLIFRPTLILAIARGGSVPGVYLSHSLKLPVSFVTWQLRDGKRKDDFKKSWAARESILIVDDINDTGNTFVEILEEIQDKTQVPRRNIKTCSLIQRKSSKFSVDFCPNNVDSEEWVVFPWEKEEGDSS